MVKRANLQWLDNRDVLLGLQRINGSDGRIANVAGCSPQYIQWLRKKHRIPACARGGAPVRHHEIWNPALLAYLVGICGNPHQVAKMLGINESTVRHAINRQKQGFEPNLKRE